MKLQKPKMQCLNRAMDILEALAQRRAMGVTDISKAVGLHVATTYNILAALQSRNYLQNDGERYRLGPAMAFIAGQIDPLVILPRLAQPQLDGITRLTGESAVVGVLAGTNLKMIATTASIDGMVSPRPDQIFPCALRLGTGRVLVANQSEREWAKHLKVYAAQNILPDDMASEDLQGWKRTFIGIRQNNQCLYMSGRDSGSIAVPIRDDTGAVIAALGANSVGMFGDKNHRKSMIEAVQRAGNILSRALGYPPNSGK